LIAPNCEALNGARNLALADGIWREDARGFDRTFFLFGEDRVDEARAAWRTLSKQDGVECRFWKQNEAGKWSRER
jgi:DNA polymerase-3 subunit chi